MSSGRLAAFRVVLAAVVAGVLVACATLGPRSVTVSQTELQGRIERGFPIERTLLGTLDVRLAAPRLALQPDSERIAIEAAVEVRELIFGRGYRGRLAFDSGLRIDAAESSLRLSAVRVTAFDLLRDNGEPDLPLGQLGTALVQRLLENRVVWQPKPEQLERLKASGVEATAVAVTAAGIRIDLAPAPAR